MHWNWNIFYAVAVGLLTVIVAGLAGQLAATKPWHKWVFWGAGLLTVILIAFQATSNEDQAAASARKQKELQEELNQIRTKLDQNKRASVGPYKTFIWPNQELLPGKSISVQNQLVVTDGMAVNYRVFDELFSLLGKHDDEMDRRAMARFTRDSYGKLAYQGEDRVKGTGSEKTLYMKFNNVEIAQLYAGRRFVYVISRVEWRNPEGADFHIDVCSYLEPPKQGLPLENLGWHTCRP